MKKSLIAAAALTAFAGAAAAQSSVSVYGLLDLGYSNAEYLKDGVSQIKRQGFATSSDNTSRWGITGVEDMGQGLKASFKIEQNIGTNPRSGLASTNKNTASANGTSGGNAYTLDNTIIGDRELWVAVEKGATRVQAGYGVTALRNLAVQTSADGTNNMGNPINHDQGAYRREGLQLSQSFGPVTATAMVSGNKQNGATIAGADSTTTDEIKVGKGFNAGLVYSQGPILLGYGYDKVDAKTPAVAASITTATFVPSVALGDTTTTTHLVAGSYDFGVVKAYAQYVSADVKNNLIGDGTGVGAGKITGTSIGLTAPVNNFVLGGQVFDGKNKRNTAISGASADTTTTFAQNRNYKGYTLRAAYNLSKRTYAYVATGEYKTDAGDKGAAASITAAGANEAKYKQTSAGIVHAF